MNKLLEILHKITDIISDIDSRIGYKKFKKYIFLLLCIGVILNFKVIMKDCIKFIDTIQQEIHSEKMAERDELNKQLVPIIASYRAELRADRLLYFEYHNTKENVLGIPFKYFELIQQDYDISSSPVMLFKDLYENSSSINTGYVSNLYHDMKENDVIICKGDSDITFKMNYPGVYDLFRQQDHSSNIKMAFISIPGIKDPIGFIVLQWNENRMPDQDTIRKVTDKYIPRINALVVSISEGEKL